MISYNLLFESVVLSAWGNKKDPFDLGNASLFGRLDNDLTGEIGHDVKFALSSSLRKVAVENSCKKETYHALMDVNKRLWSTLKYADICKVLDETKVIFTGLGMIIC